MFSHFNDISIYGLYVEVVSYEKVFDLITSNGNFF